VNAAPRQPKQGPLKHLLVSLCGLLAAVALFGIMGLTFVDVMGRKFFSGSLPGALELTELLMVVVIFTSLPLVALAGEHVAFDSLDRWLPGWLRRTQRTVMELFCAAALAGLAWLMWVKAGQLSAYGDTTSQLKLPLGVFVYGMSALLALAAAAHLMVTAEQWGVGASSAGAVSSGAPSTGSPSGGNTTTP
jgi:TRAP-type transport system small permease protein